MSTPETLDRVKAVIRRCLKLSPDATLEDRMPLHGGEYELDSLDILLIVTELEREFGIKIRDGSLDRAAFADVATLSDFIEHQRQ
ncbi:MAG: acyl carrier protein [Phycisphaerales bacterium]